jgi:rubrerythrin
MKIEFTSLSPHQALEVAILIEERNARLYESFAQLFADFIDEESQGVAATFRETAEEERRHRRDLEKRYVERYGVRLSSLSEEAVSDVIELPELGDDDDIFDPDTFTRSKALQVALAAEHHARCYYTRLSGLTHDPHLRRLYHELAEFEQDHEEFLRQTLKQAED